MTTADANVDAPADTDVYAGTARNADTDTAPSGYRYGGATASGKTKEDAVSPEEARIPKHCTLDS